MPVPSPDALLRQYPARTPEALAAALGLTVQRTVASPALPGVTVYSEYRSGVILLYPFASDEQWHIAHELYHALAEREGISPWHLDESAADRWADALLARMS